MFEFLLNHLCGLMIVFGSLHAMSLITKFRERRALGRIAFKRIKNFAWFTTIFVVTFSYLGSVNHFMDAPGFLPDAMPVAQAEAVEPLNGSCTNHPIPGVKIKTWGKK